MMKWKWSIPPLEDLTVPKRIVLTMAIVVLILFVLFALGDREAVPEVIPVVSKWDEHITQLEKQALDEAFKKYIMQLYNIWVSDNYQPRMPPKALVGARNARDAYVRTMEAIERREQELIRRDEPHVK